MKIKDRKDVLFDNLDFFSYEKNTPSIVIEGELLPKQDELSSIQSAIYVFIDVAEIKKTEKINTDKLSKKTWTKCYKSIYSKVSETFSIDALRDAIDAISNNMDEQVLLTLKTKIEDARGMNNSEDFIYSSLNLLSKYHEIKRISVKKKLALNIDTGVLSIDFVKEGKEYDTMLNLAFCSNGNVAFFSYDNDDDGHSISGYMTHSGKYKSSKKIQSILNILEKNEW